MIPESTKQEINAILKRNKERLFVELQESKELMQLIAKSTTKDLSEDEWKKVKTQLLDIFKSIPAFAIFMLPGGALLLPLVLKLIPQLLPSAFSNTKEPDEN